MLSESAARERALNDTIAELRQENAELHALIDVQKTLIAELEQAVDEDAAPRIAVIAGMASPIEYEIVDGGCAGPDGLNYETVQTRSGRIVTITQAEIDAEDAMNRDHDDTRRWAAA